MLIAKRGLRRLLGSEVADWATDLLVEDKDTPHLRQLAGATGTENSFELEELFDRAVHELGLTVPDAAEAVVLYARELARDYLDDHLSRDQLLRQLCELCEGAGYRKELYPFYLLRWTAYDLQTQDVSHYLADVTKENFDERLHSELDTLIANEPTKA
jgi:hypothetical protein